MFRVETNDSLGSGFVFSDTSHIVTCYHVIEGATKVRVISPDGIACKVRSIKLDKRCDVAILSLSKPCHSPPLPPATYNEVGPGDPVVVIGSPLGVLDGSISSGIVSSKRRDDYNILQFTAPISPGSSGSPVLDSRGRVVAVARASFTMGQNLNLGTSVADLKNSLKIQDVSVRDLQRLTSPVQAIDFIYQMDSAWKSLLRWNIRVTQCIGAKQLAPQYADVLKFQYNFLSNLGDDDLNAFISKAKSGGWSESDCDQYKEFLKSIRKSAASLVQDSDDSCNAVRDDKDIFAPARKFDSEIINLNTLMKDLLAWAVTKSWINGKTKSFSGSVGINLTRPKLNGFLADVDTPDCRVGLTWCGSCNEGDIIAAYFEPGVTHEVKLRNWEQLTLFLKKYSDLDSVQILVVDKNGNSRVESFSVLR